MVAASNTMITPSKISKEELHQKVLQALAANGDMPVDEWRKFLTMVVSDIWEHVQNMAELPAKVKKLEENSILMRMKKDRGSAALWVVAISMFFYMLHDILPWLVSRFTEITSIVK